MKVGTSVLPAAECPLLALAAVLLPLVTSDSRGDFEVNLVQLE